MKFLGFVTGCFQKLSFDFCSKMLISGASPDFSIWGGYSPYGSSVAGRAEANETGSLGVALGPQKLKQWRSSEMHSEHPEG